MGKQTEEEEEEEEEEKKEEEEEKLLLGHLHTPRLATPVVECGSGMFLAGFLVFGASHAVSPSLFRWPERPGVMVWFGREGQFYVLCWFCWW